MHPTPALCGTRTELATSTTGPGLIPLSTNCLPSCELASRPCTYRAGHAKTDSEVLWPPNIVQGWLGERKGGYRWSATELNRLMAFAQGDGAINQRMERVAQSLLRVPHGWLA